MSSWSSMCRKRSLAAKPCCSRIISGRCVAGIASGAAEIQLNLIATDLLKLPREPR